MTATTSLIKSINSLTEKYREDLIMLDALNQWATNPTSASAGYGIKENYSYITMNLRVRYPEVDCEKIIEKLQLETDEITSKYDVYECRGKIETTINEKYGEALRSKVLARIQDLEIEQKKLVYAYLKSTHPDSSLIIWESSALEEIDRLRARFCASLDSSTLRTIEPLSLLVRVGILNELLWITSKGHRHREYVIPKFLKPLFAEIESYVKQDVPDLPDVRDYIKLLIEKMEFEQLRLLDELISSQGITGDLEVKRRAMSTTGIIGGYGNFVAISPLIFDDMKKILGEEKASLLASSKAEIEEILHGIRNKFYPEVELVEEYVDDLPSWILEVEGHPPLYIRLVPWMLRNDVLSMDETRIWLWIVTNQSLPSLSTIISSQRTVGLSILCKFRKRLILRAFGRRHRMLDEIIELLREKQYEVSEETKLVETSRTKEQFEMKPEKPFTNLMEVFELMGDLDGSVLLLDRHFDEEGFKFLNRINPSRVRAIRILMGRTHLSRDFKELYKAFRDELSHKGINMQLRVVEKESEKEIHDRYLISQDLAYNTPPWNIINQKLGDIKKVEAESKKKYFERYWSNATDILNLTV